MTAKCSVVSALGSRVWMGFTANGLKVKAFSFLVVNKEEMLHFIFSWLRRSFGSLDFAKCFWLLGLV